MNWQEICEHPDLQNLPFKIELNANGQILYAGTGLQPVPKLFFDSLLQKRFGRGCKPRPA
jgi:hypothetical protein